MKIYFHYIINNFRLHLFLCGISSIHGKFGILQEQKWGDKSAIWWRWRWWRSIFLLGKFSAKLWAFFKTLYLLYSTFINLSSFFFERLNLIKFIFRYFPTLNFVVWIYCEFAFMFWTTLQCWMSPILGLILKNKKIERSLNDILVFYRQGRNKKNSIGIGYWSIKVITWGESRASCKRNCNTFLYPFVFLSGPYVHHYI